MQWLIHRSTNSGQIFTENVFSRFPLTPGTRFLLQLCIRPHVQFFLTIPTANPVDDDVHGERGGIGVVTLSVQLAVGEDDDQLLTNQLMMDVHLIIESNSLHEPSREEMTTFRTARQFLSLVLSEFPEITADSSDAEKKNFIRCDTYYDRGRQLPLRLATPHPVHCSAEFNSL